jgi:hypothetical protein
MCTSVMLPLSGTWPRRFSSARHGAVAGEPARAGAPQHERGKDQPRGHVQRQAHQQGRHDARHRRGAPQCVCTERRRPICAVVVRAVLQLRQAGRNRVVQDAVRHPDGAVAAREEESVV